MRLLLQLIFKGCYYFLKSKSKRYFYWLVLKYAGRKRFTTTSVSLGSKKLKVPDTLSFLWQYHDIFVERQYQFEPQNNPVVIYDVGANIGMSCIFFANHYQGCRIEAFEADPTIAAFCEYNISAYNINNVNLHKQAVWIDDNGILLAVEGADGASIISEGKKIQVPSVRLKTCLEKEIYIDLLKMDIEGAETSVILDCKDELHKINNIFIEYHSFLNHPQSLAEILQVLQEKKFRYHLIPVNCRKVPFVNKKPKGDFNIDLQLNIFAYKD